MSIVKILTTSINQSRIKISNVKKMKKRQVKRVGIIVTKHFEAKKKIKDMVFKLKQELGSDVEIITTGETDCFEKFVKLYAIDFDMAYKEFIPAHKEKTLYSVSKPNFYGQEYSKKNEFVRDKMFASYIDYLIVFHDKRDIDERTYLINNVQKLQKNIVTLI